MPNPTVANILTGPVVVWYAPEGEAFPDENSIDLGDAWGGNWARLGATNDDTPLSCLYDFEEFDRKIMEALTAVKRAKSGEDLTLETTLAEITSDYMHLAMEGTVTETAAGAAQVGKDELDVGGDQDLTVRAWGFEGTYTDGSGNSFPVRVFIYRGTGKINGALEFAKDQSPGVPLQVKALADISQSVGEQLFKFQRVTAAMTV